MNRRELMARAAALNVVLAAVPRAFAVPGLASQVTPLERVVVDTRLQPSVAFAATLAAHGTRVSATDGDLTSLWFDDLARHFAAGGAPVTGLTSARTALVMIELARGPGVRVLWRAEHRTMPDGSLRHELQGTASLVTRATAIGKAPDWFESLASALAGSAHAPSGQTPLVSAVAHSLRTAGRLEEPLSSWVIVPRHAHANARNVEDTA